jgi:glutaredoxin 3
MSDQEQFPERHANDVVIYGRRSCIFCRMAMGWFHEQDIEHRFVSVEGDHPRREALSQLTGQQTVPQIFIRAEPIGGYRELLAEAASGALERRLSDEGENPTDVR